MNLFRIFPAILLMALCITQPVGATEFSGAINPNTASTVSEQYFEKLLVTGMEKTGNAIESAVEFVLEEAPKAVQELLAWKFTESLVFFIIGVVMWFNILPFLYVIYRNRKNVDCSGNIGNYLALSMWAAAIYVMITIWFCVVTVNLDWLKIKVAPRIFLIEYASSLYKGATKNGK